MRLRDYLKQMSQDQRDAFASLVVSSTGHLKNVGYGYKSCSSVLAAAIERHSGSKVKRWDLRPDDWHLIWPELIGTKGAPKVKPLKKAA